MATIMTRPQEGNSDDEAGTVVAVPLTEHFVGPVRRRMTLLMGAVTLVLLIACANLANLLLARAVRRRHEIAVRRALGASRRRIFGLLLAESLVLSLTGGAAGLALGAGFLRLLLAVIPSETPRFADIGLDATVMAYTLVTTLAAALLAGTFPALSMTAEGTAGAREARRATRGSERYTAGRLLVVSQTALAVTLVFGSGLLLRSFGHLTDVDPGIRIEAGVTFRVTLNPGRGEDDLAALRFFERVDERLAQLPGVESVTRATYLPLRGSTGLATSFYVRGREDLPESVFLYRLVKPNYHETVGARLLEGRFFDESDRGAEHRVAILNESLARRFWPDGGALGSWIFLGSPADPLVAESEVVGIVADSHDISIGEEPRPVAYVPSHSMGWWRSYAYVVRGSVDPASLIPGIRQELRAIDPTMPLYSAETLQDRLDDSLAPARSTAILLGVFAAIALALAAVGLYGVSSYLAGQRTRELALRLVLGARPGGLRRLVLRQGLLQAVAGLVVGLCGAWMLGRTMTSLLAGVTPGDPATLAASVLVLLAVMALAADLPARRATRIQPAEVLRDED